MIELTIQEKVNPYLERVRQYKHKNKDKIKQMNKPYKERNSVKLGLI